MRLIWINLIMIGKLRWLKLLTESRRSEACEIFVDAFFPVKSNSFEFFYELIKARER